MIAELVEILATADNSGHTAMLRSAQIQPYGWTSYVRRTLGKRPISWECYHEMDALYRFGHWNSIWLAVSYRRRSQPAL